MRACAIKMHVHMSQETSEEPLFTEIYGKHPAAQIGPKTTAQTLCEPAQSKCMSRFHKSHFYGNLQGNAAAQIGPRTQTYTLCEPASKCMSTCHKRHQKSHFIRQITGKMPRPRLGPKRRRRRCASLRSRNACQDFTRATFYGNLQGKCRGPDWAQNADIHFV